MVYLPILSIRPAEVVALSELPDVSKDGMTPLILIKPWLGTGALSRGVDKILHGFPARTWFAELDPEYVASPTSEAYAEIQRLRNPSDGFRQWIDYVGRLPNAVPVLQFRGASSQAEILKQIDSASALGRGICVRIDRSIVPVGPIVDLLSQKGGDSVSVVIDYGQQDARLLVNAIPAQQDVFYIRERLPNARVSLSSTTFPSNFANDSQEIYERSFFDLVNGEVGGLLFSDRGSARAVEQSGGGVPRPRIDLPTSSRWHFFRSDCTREEDETDEEFRERRIEAYGEMADAAVSSYAWDDSLNIWGTQLIKITQLRSSFGINSPAKATACRINIHLARQSLYGRDISSSDLEEDWVD